MSAKLYPFIDIAVHERVREHFARGDAAVLFSPDISRVLWSNGEGARLFGMPSIYDFIDSGAGRGDVAFRQMEAAARQLQHTGDRRTFLMRIGAGFRSMPVTASVELIAVYPGEKAVLFSAPHSGRPLSPGDCAQRMISGFDDPDTHMAVLDGDGGIVASSAGFAALAMTPQTCRALVAAVARDSNWLVKRPIPTGKGHLPAAIGKLSDSPALHLLFAVETILGNMDPGTDFDEPEPSLATAVAPDGPANAAVQTDDADSAQLSSDAAAVPSHGAPDEETASTGHAMGPQDDPSPADEALPEAPSGQTTTATETVTAADAPVDEPSAADDPDAEIAVDAAGVPQADAVPGDAAGDASDPARPEQVADVAMTGADGLDEGIDDAPEAVPGLGPDQDDVAVDGKISTQSIEASRDDAAGASPNIDAFADEDDQQAQAGFVFNPNSRAVRFVWKIDSDGRFREISDEFATAVGPVSADISGVTFTEVAQRYHLDADGKIGALLKRRDTWSGKTILWPVEGTSLQVPVDLAALPTYSRNREFDGFRGFGIVRVSDALEDTHALGLSLGARAPSPVETAPDDGTQAEMPRDAGTGTSETSASETGASETGIPEAGTSETGTPEAAAATVGAAEIDADDAPAGETPTGLAEPDTTAEDDAVPPETAEDAVAAGDLTDGPEQAASVSNEADIEPAVADPFFGERPALQLVETPGRRETDKIVLLDSHRPQGLETLTRGEQAAFREIARQLGETFGKRTNTGVTEARPPAEPVEPPEEPVDAAIEDQETATSEITPMDDQPATTATDADPADADPVDADQADAVATAEADETPEGDGENAVPDVIEDIVAPRAGTGSGLGPELLDTLPVALLVHAGDDLFHANPEFLKLTGYGSLDALREEGGIDALFVAEEDGLFDMPDGTMMMIRNDGHLMPVNARLQSIRWADKGALMMALSQAPAVAANADMDTRATAPAVATPETDIDALRMETEELRSILETATDGVAVVGADGEIRSLNRSASALFNYDDGEIRGKPFAMLFAHESQKAVLDYLAGLSGHGVASVLNDGREVIGREASGGFIPLFMTMGRLSSSNGYCAVIRDITQWKRTEEELRNAKRAAETANAHKSDFLARVSHEIRTPLNAIIGFSDMMASEHFGAIGNPRYVEYANDIGRSGRHVLDIVNDLLDISKIEAGEMELEFTAVEINDAVSEAVSLVQPQANSQRVIIRTSLSGSVPNIVADSRSIKQIALNILSNAIRFTPSGGQIVVSTAYEANGSVLLRIRDTGIGMTRTELEQAMKPFRQVTTGARKRGDGTGLGLPLTKAMAEANRALFSINSAPNEGTLVEIAFPSQRVLAD